jgi:3D (Asp-Asp-Asp) domain-containing protein
MSTVENWDRRFLAAIRITDALTGITVTSALQVSAYGTFIARSASGIYVLLDAPGFHAYSNTFDIGGQAVPASTNLTLRVQDPAGQYLPRLASVVVPRSTTLPASDPGSVLQAQKVALYLSPAASVRDSWASLYVTVTSSDASKQPLPWTLVQAQDPATSKILATGLADARGQALLPVPVPKVSAGTTEVIATSKAVNVLATFDPSVLTAGPNYIPNPDAFISPPATTTLKNSTTAATAQAGVATAVPVQIAL